jgi:ABC-2 type transport system permease protein
MLTNTQAVALYTLVRREMVRMFRIPGQIFLPPIITTLLYFLIFGDVIGQRIGTIGGHEFTAFIAPGLIMIAVITNSYTNVSSSLFSVRFQKSIEEMLVSPMHWSILLFGYVLGGIARGVMIGGMLLAVTYCFAKFNLAHLPLIMLVLFLTSALFSLAGFLNGMFARTFDGIAVVPTFVLSPLTYLGGVFYTITMLPPFWRNIAAVNPIFYMVNALRHAMLGQSEANFSLALSIIGVAIIILIAINCILIKNNVGLRE